MKLLTHLTRSKKKLDPFHKDHPRNRKKKIVTRHHHFVNDDDVHTFDHNDNHPSKK